MKTLAEINAKIVLLMTAVNEVHDPELGEITLLLAEIQEELIEMDLYGTYTPNP